MKTANVITKPILSEKAYKLMEQGVYTFLVNEKARKEEIAKAVTKQFGVSIDKVNVYKIQKKLKRIARTRKTVKVGGGKKATIWVKKGQTIASLLPKAEKKQTKNKAEKEVEKVSVEGKEG